MIPAEPSYEELGALAEAIADKVTAEEVSPLVVVNIEDEELSGLIARGGTWFEYPGQNHAPWMSVAMAAIPDEAARGQLLLDLEHSPAALENALQSYERTDRSRMLVARVPQSHLAELADDITGLNMRGWKLRVVAFCADADVVARGAKLFNVRHWAVQFEAAIRDALESWRQGAPVGRANWSESAEAIASGIAGLSDCSFDAARRLLRTVHKVYQEEFGPGALPAPKEQQKAFHQRAVLRLLRSSSPDVYLRAESSGVLPELAYGLQRCSLLLGAEPSNDLAAVLGDEMPKGYQELANDLVFLRWYEDISRPFPFSSPDEVADVNDIARHPGRPERARRDGAGRPDGSTAFDEKAFLRDLGDALGDALDEETPRSSSDENGNLHSVFVALVEMMGGSTEYAHRLQRGLAVLGDSIDLEGVRRLMKVVEVLQRALTPPLDTLRDIRFAIVVRLLIKRIQTQVLPLLADWRKSCERKVAEGGAEGGSGRRVEAGIAGRLRGFIKVHIDKALSGSGMAAAAERPPPTRAPGALDADVGDSLLRDVTQIRDDMFHKRLTLLAEAHDRIERLIRDANRKLSDQRVLVALMKLSRSTSRRLDMSAEKLRFQMYLLGDSWMEAERHLSLLKLQVDSRAELSRADVILMEGTLLEARGQTRAAWNKFDALRSEIDPSVDPVVWTRASYGALRTQLAMRSKPLDAALAGALAIVDLENQRRAGKALQGQRRKQGKELDRLFVSFRGPVRDWARELGKNFMAAVDSVEFDIDEMRRSTDDFDTTIQMRLLEAKYIVVVLTRDFFESPWCINELHTALHLRRFNSDCELGWLFLNANVSSGNRDDAELFVRAQFAVPSNINLGVNEQYLEERFRRLTELGTKIGKGVYSDSEQPSADDWRRFATRARELAEQNARNNGG